MRFYRSHVLEFLENVGFLKTPHSSKIFCECKNRHIFVRPGAESYSNIFWNNIVEPSFHLLTNVLFY